LGYVEGENLIIERYSAEGYHERYADLAREIVTRNPDVIVTGTNPVVIVFKAATSTIPVVAFMLDPLKAGLVTSLARPGGNLTGITLDAGIEICGKRLANLVMLVPSAERHLSNMVRRPNVWRRYSWGVFEPLWVTRASAIRRPGGPRRYHHHSMDSIATNYRNRGGPWTQRPAAVRMKFLLSAEARITET
jgi:ABC transporter substrate binding protein